MKKFYEAPVVELTGFSVEDVITTSVPTPVTVNTIDDMDAAARATLAGQLTSGDTKAYDYQSYQW